MTRVLITNYALINLYNHYYIVSDCVLASSNEDILIILFLTELLLNQYIELNNIELPKEDLICQLQ